MTVAITRGPSALSDGWIAAPVTRRRALAVGVDRLRRRFGEIEVPDADGVPTLAVTSGYVFDVLREHHLDIPSMPIACVGAATAANAGRPVAFVGPAPATAASLAKAILASPQRPRRVVFPASQRASNVLEYELARAGIAVERIDLYTTETDPAAVARLEASAPACIIVTASSAAQALAECWVGDLPPLVAIGQPTATELAQLGHPATATATSPDRAGLEAALEKLSRTLASSPDSMKG